MMSEHEPKKLALEGERNVDHLKPNHGAEIHTFNNSCSTK